MATQTREETEALEIRTLMDDAAQAVREKDIVGALSGYAPDVLSFDVVNPLRSANVEAVRDRLETWFSSFQGPIGYEVRDLSIAAGGGVAFCHGLNHVSATMVDGQKPDMWWRATLCFRKHDGRWLVTHAHSSVPFDPQSGRASLDLKP